MNRRMTITVTATGFLLETEYESHAGYWSCLSRTFVSEFPMRAVDRVAARGDYRVHIRVKVSR